MTTTQLTCDVFRYRSITWDRQFDIVDDLYRGFATLGLTTLASSRLGAYRRAFSTFRRVAAGEAPFTHRTAEEILATLVEVRQLHLIVSAAETAPDRSLWKPRLAALLSGGPRPRTDERHSPARDVQFESFLAAVASLSGLDACFAEPDVLVRSEGWALGIAAKRPRSARGFRRRVREAVRQLRRSGMPGVIAIDASFAVYPDVCIRTNDQDGATIFVKQAGDRIASQILRDEASALRTDGVLGLLVQVHLPVLNLAHPTGPQVLTAVRWTCACVAHDLRAAWFADFAARCELGLFGPPTLAEEQSGSLHGLHISASASGAA
jgi:hypothetical protein